METLKTVLGAVAVIAIAALLLRLIGSWVLRIDEIIRNQKSILSELQKLNSKND